MLVSRWSLEEQMCCCSVGMGGLWHVPQLPGASNTSENACIWKGAIFPHLHKPSWKVYSLIPGPLRYKRAEDLGLFSLQSLSFLIRQIQTYEDNSRLGSVKEGWRTKQLIKKSVEERKLMGQVEGAKMTQKEKGNWKRRGNCTETWCIDALLYFHLFLTSVQIKLIMHCNDYYHRMRYSMLMLSSCCRWSSCKWQSSQRKSKGVLTKK